MRRAHHLLVTLTFVAATSGCASVDAEAIEATLVRSLEQQASQGLTPFDSTDRRQCAAGGIMEAVGAERLDELGLTDPTGGGGALDDLGLTDDDLARIGAAVEGCLVADDVLGDVVAGLYPPESLPCLLEALPASFADRTIGAIAVGLDPIAYEAFFETLVDAETACPPS